ncbi:hypothetical protein DYY66_1517 [Candidatus Nitrosotalea sp. FS]|nr:hypothetical protein [Candidatus Nitrosotalea sp. FS]
MTDPCVRHSGVFSVSLCSRGNKSSPNCYPVSPWILNKIL